MKKMFISIIVVVAIIAAGIYSVRHFYETKANEIADKTEHYLIDHENKKKEEIKEVKGLNSKGGDYGVLVRVIFKDHPSIHHFYKQINGKIVYDGNEDISKVKEPVL